MANENEPPSLPEDGFHRSLRSLLDDELPQGPTEPGIDPDEGSAGGSPPPSGPDGPPSGWGGWGKDGPWRGPGKPPKPRRPGPKGPGLRKEKDKDLQKV